MLPVCWAALILALTSVPGSAVPDVGIGASDKVVHLLLYGILGALAMRAAWDPARAVRLVVIVTLAVSLFGALDELHQLFVPGRGADFVDWLADSAGGFSGALVIAAMGRGRKEAT
jgi:VanZ family protein